MYLVKLMNECVISSKYHHRCCWYIQLHDYKQNQFLYVRLYAHFNF